MEPLKKKNFIFLFIVIGIFLLAMVLFLISEYHRLVRVASIKDFTYQKASVSGAVLALPVEEPPKKLENPPTIIKAAYVTGWSAGSKNYLGYLDNLFAITQINAVVVDVKDYSGIVSYNTGAQKAREYGAYRPEIPDINALVKDLHAKGIYVIGRVVVFEDPMLARHRPDLAVFDTFRTQDAARPVLWKNNGGLAWVDPASKEAWDYNIDIAKDALLHGFDEINFDYIRFPTDGNTTNMGFPIWDQKTPEHLVIKNFFQHLRESLPDAKISADVFGQITTDTDDMGIGQILEDSFSYFDYICPMVYPSHYASGFLGYKNPANFPYEIITYAIDSAMARRQVYANVNNVPEGTLAKIRPWLQDFNLGAVYTPAMVKKEIQAVSDSTGQDFSGYLLWNPSNVYTQLPGAL